MTQRNIRIAYGLACVASLATGLVLALGIFNAWRDWRGPNRLIVPLCVDRPATAQLFYDQGQGIRAEDCASVPLPGGGTALRELAFPVPRVALREVRFDPMIAVGKFAIGAPRLESASGRVIAKFPLTAVVPRQQIAGWRREGDRWSGETEAEANDPQLTFGMGGPLRVGTPRIPWIELLAFFATAAVREWLRRRQELGGWRFTSAVDAGLAGVRGWLADPGRGGLPTKAWRWVTGPGGWLAGAVLVAVIQLWLLWPLHRVIDWPLWDEANYAARGLTWAAHGGQLGPLHSSPLYVIMYGWLSGAGDLGTMICAQHYVVKFGSTLLLYFILARWWRSAVAAAAVALLWAATQYQLEFPLLVYQAAWLWFLAALLTADRLPLAALGFTLLAACTRQEYQFAAAALLAWYGWRAWRQHWSWRDWLARGRGRVGGALLAAVVWGGAGYVLAHTDLTTKESGSRAWFAFEQHYAVRAVMTGEEKGINPWIDYRTLIQRDFPGADSLSAAWRVNAAGVKHHVGYNLTHAAGEVAGLGEIHAGLQTAAWVLLVAALVGLSATANLKSERDRAGDERARQASSVLAGAAFLAIAPGLIVLAKGAYLLALVPGVLGAAGWLWWRGIRWPAIWRARVGWMAPGLLVVGCVILMRAPQPFVPCDRVRPVAETVAELKKDWPATGREVLWGVAATSYAQYLGEDRCEGVEALAEVTGRPGNDVSLERSFAEVKPRAVLVTDDWRSSPRFDGEKLARLLAAPEWTMRAVPAGQLYIKTGR